MTKSPMARNHRGPGNPNWNGGEYTAEDGYVYLWRPDHPLANERGYVMRATVVWEEAHGNQPFPEGMAPHHKNGVRNDDRPDNIEPKTRSEHAKEHIKTCLRDSHGMFRRKAA